MVISGVKIKLILGGNENLLAIASVLLDDVIVIKDIKIIRTNEKMFVAMPSRKATDRCRKCRCKNNTDAKFCNKCGLSLPATTNTHSKLHSDIVHPITVEFRKQFENAVLQAYTAESEVSKLPGYRPAMESGFDAAVIAYTNDVQVGHPIQSVATSNPSTDLLYTQTPNVTTLRASQLHKV